MLTDVNQFDSCQINVATDVGAVTEAISNHLSVAVSNLNDLGKS